MMSSSLYMRNNGHNLDNSFGSPPRAPPLPPKEPRLTTQVTTTVRYNTSEKDVVLKGVEDDYLMGLFEKVMKLVAETWISEIVSMLLSLAALVGLVMLLYHYDGEENPQWSSTITLNAILSVSVTIMIAALTVPLSSGLGQLKWIRTRQAAIPLSHIDFMDQASRGMWGSLMVICSWSGGFIGTVGALTFILTMIVAPLSQQAIQIAPERALVRGEAAFITICNGSDSLSPNGSKDIDGGFSSSNLNALPSEMRGAYYNALYGNFDNSSVSKGFATCPTGNCTWNPFATLSIRSECKNVTEFLVRDDGNGDILKSSVTLPGGPKWTPTMLYNISTTEKSSRIAFHNATAIRFAGLDGRTAIECDISFVVEVIEASVENGLLKEKVLRTYTDSVEEPDSEGRSLIQRFHPPMPVEPPFTAPIHVGGFDPLWVNRGFTFLGAVGGTIDFEPEPELLQTMGNGNLTSIMDNVALAMSRALRVVASGSNSTPGSAWKVVNILHITWYWLSAAFLVEVLGLIFFVSMLVLNAQSGAKLWKTSILAAYFHGLLLSEPRQPPETVNYEGLYAMDIASEKIEVKLSTDASNNGYASRLVQQ